MLVCMFEVYFINKKENFRGTKYLRCCKANLHTCFGDDCSACPHFCLEWSDVSEREESMSLRCSWRVFISSTGQAVLEGRERGKGTPTDSLCVKRQAHDVYLSVMYSMFFFSVWDPRAQAKLEHSVCNGRRWLFKILDYLFRGPWRFILILIKKKKHFLKTTTFNKNKSIFTVASWRYFNY